MAQAASECSGPEAEAEAEAEEEDEEEDEGGGLLPFSILSCEW